MAFKSYLALRSPDGTWTLTAPEALRFSGPLGLVARQLADLPPEALARWTFTDDQWLERQNSSTASSRWIVFEQVESGKLILSRVLQINGAASNEQTELLVKLSPLTLLSTGHVLVVAHTEGGRAWNEELVLDGDPRRRNSTWKWCERTMQLGTSVFGK